MSANSVIINETLDICHVVQYIRLMLNTPNTIHFYLKNNFHFLIEDERLEAKYMNIGMGRLPLHTRFMYYDLVEMRTENL